MDHRHNPWTINGLLVDHRHNPRTINGLLVDHRHNPWTINGLFTQSDLFFECVNPKALVPYIILVKKHSWPEYMTTA